ncbi:MAG: hypothetical protein KDA52_04745 [Planctomycetaceae bacterium]|nr:hypothetical protein [Planctomycetaceae bacterium]
MVQSQSAFHLTITVFNLPTIWTVSTRRFSDVLGGRFKKKYLDGSIIVRWTFHEQSARRQRISAGTESMIAESLTDSDVHWGDRIFRLVKYERIDDGYANTVLKMDKRMLAHPSPCRDLFG